MEYQTPSKTSIAANLFLKEKTYWLQQFEGSLEISLFPQDPRSTRCDECTCGTTGEEPAFVDNTIDPQLSAQLLRMSGGSDIRLYMVLAAGLTILLHNYTGNNDIIIASPIEKQETQGNFVNTVLALRTQLTPTMSFKELLLQLRKTIIDAHQNQNFPIETLLNFLEMPSNDDQNRLLHVGILLENVHSIDFLNPVKLDMIFHFTHEDDNIKLRLFYRSSLYNKEKIEQILCHYTALLRHGCSQPDTRVDDLEMMSEEEKNRLLVAFNQPGTDDKIKLDWWENGMTIPRVFEEQVQKRPQQTAIVTEKESISYEELNRRANRLARLLQEKGVKQETVAGIMLPPSADLAVAILAVLKAGGAWLPLDSQAPTQRISAMLEDSNIHLLITQSTEASSHPFTILQRLDKPSPSLFLTPPRQRIANLDQLPFPDRSLVNYEKYSRFIGQGMVKSSMVLSATRGCPYRCAYCFKILSNQYIFRSAENIFREIQQYYQIGVRRFVFIDDIFNLDKENGMTLFKLIRDHGMKIQILFPSGFRGDILTRDYIDSMVEAGTISFGLALETASPRLQDLIKKRLDIDKFRENVEYICSQYPHVILELFTMHGFPTETEEEARMTLDFIKSIRWIHFPYINILKIYHNTSMEKMALEKGITPGSIHRSQGLAFHELPDTLPFDKSFTLNYQEEYLNTYFMNRERLLQVLPYQMQALTEDEMIQKYDSYLPMDIRSFSDILAVTGISREDLGNAQFLKEEDVYVPDLNTKLQTIFPNEPPAPSALKLLLLDLSQYFNREDNNMLYDVAEPPMGLMYIAAYLNQRFGSRVRVKIAKSRMDFDNYEQLKQLMDQFQPHMIGIRSLTYYKDFFHQTIASIRHWGFDVPIVTGGPYATLDYETILSDPNIDLAVIGEGEYTFGDLIEKTLENNGKLPGEKVLQTIDGLGYIPKNAGSLPLPVTSVYLMDSLPGTLEKKDGSNLESSPEPGNLAYIMYTSGSTGTPKGVMVEHRNAVNVLEWFGSYYSLDENTHVLQPTPCTFDPSVEQILGTLLHGAVLYIPPREVLGHPDAFRAYVNKHQIHMINYVPGFLRELLADSEKLPHLHTVISGGDKLDEVLKDCLIEKGYNVYNQYGPTETTIDALCGKCRPGPVTLGKPVSHVRCYVLDKQERLVPAGVPGYLYIGGEGVSRGYLNNPELTRGSFAHLFVKRWDQKLLLDNFNINKSFGKVQETLSRKGFLAADGSFYNTGDLVQWTMDGEIQFLGRDDRQVKIRGVRIELAEIERHLMQDENIKEAVVTFWEKEQALCAYIVPKPTRALFFNPAVLKDHLAARLPESMIPNAFICLESIPRTAHGKVDLKALPVPGVSESHHEFIAPETELEKKLAGIWSEVLERDLDEIGRDTNFFDIGGHSLKATLLASRINHAFNHRIPLGEIFRLPTVKTQAGYLKEIVTPTPVQGKDEIAVLLKKGRADGKNLFFAHDGTGEVDGYVELSNHLSDGFNCWGIKADFHDELGPRDITFPQIAAVYARAIRKIQPKGPYYIAGWSLGGAVAFEIVRQLEISGERVAFFAMVDAYKPDPHRYYGHFDPFSLQTELEWILEYLPSPGLKEHIAGAKDSDHLWSLVLGYLETSQFDLQLLKKRIPPYVAEVIPNFQQLNLKQSIYYLNRARSFDKAWFQYTPHDRIKTPVHFFAAGRSEEKNDDTWKPYCHEARIYSEIDGDHYSIFKNPAVIELAQKFDKAIENIL